MSHKPSGTVQAVLLSRALLELLFWVFCTPAALAALFSIWSGRKFQEHVEGAILGEPDPDEQPYQPPATVILPVRGLDYDFAANLLSLADQDYPDYELLIVSRQADGTAAASARVTLADRARLVTAGPPPDDTGEKVHNLLVAVEQARPESEVFVFADSDGQVGARWLANLVQPLGDDSLGATTSFRWYIPEDGGFWPLLRSAWDATIAGSMRDDDKNFAWGGGMALRRETFDEANVAEFWRGTVSDDYRLTHAMNKARKGIRFVPAAMVATGGGCSRNEFLSWATRQLIITKAYRKKLWVAGFVSHVIYCGAMVMSALMALTGNPLGVGGFVVTVIPGMAKGGSRGYAGRLMFPDRADWFDSNGWVYFWYTPIATWVWLYLFAASAKGRTIEWRDYVYELVSESKTRVLRGPD